MSGIVACVLFVHSLELCAHHTDFIEEMQQAVAVDYAAGASAAAYGDEENVDPDDHA